MRLRLTLVDPLGAGGPVDCAVLAEPGTALAQVHDDLLHAVGRRSGRLYCAGADLADAVLGVPPLLQAAILTVDRPTLVGPVGLLELHVSSGPDSGGVHPLPPGEHTVGRAAEAAVRVDDPDVSRLHAVVRLAADGATVHDLGSTNGTTVAGRRVGREGRRLEPGEPMRVGQTCLELTVAEVHRAACRPDGEGRIQLNRPPRLLPPTTRAQVTLPPAPVAREPARLPLLALLVPLAAGLILVAVTRSPTYLLLALLSPLMVLGGFLSDRNGGRRSAAAHQRTYDEALARARSRIAEAVAEETHARHRASPGAATLLLTATGPLPRLWERRPTDPDFLDIRVGTGDLPAAVEVRRPDAERPGDPPPTLAGAPVVVPLGEVGVVGIAGPRSRALSVARFAVAQLAGWHSPRQLGLVVLVSDSDAADEWAWARWLPHLCPTAGENADLLVGLDPVQVQARVSELVAVLGARREQVGTGLGGTWSGRPAVLVLDGASALRRQPGVARLLQEGPAVGLHVLCLEADPLALPVECSATVELTGDVTSRLRVAVRGRAPHSDVIADGVSDQWAARFARALAPLADAATDGDGTGLADHVRLLDLLEVDATSAAALEGSWRARPRSSRVTLGLGADGRRFEVDLRTDGPHALVAGTTGSGKSELLQTLVAGLAVANRPDQMSFVLIDYKGGAAFKDCARLPHTVGMVTDLDPHLTERALTSLGAELRRRETILRDASCKDIDDYLSTTHADPSPMPRLVLVVDEFATLADELPDFVGGLVGIAQRGRSLGVHLVLATQRPGGVVSADIRANTSLRIALRVTDPSESADVVDVKDAAAISRATPGRAVARVGRGTVLPFQSARVGGRAEAAGARTAPCLVQPLAWTGAGHRPQTRHTDADDNAPTDLALVVEAARRAAQRLRLAPARSPWLAPLSPVVTLDDLPSCDADPRSSGGSWRVPFGVRDLPAEQRRAALALDLEHGGHLLVVGAARSGRSTLLRTLAASAASRFAASDVHLYAIDGGSGALACLAGLPHCGAVVGRDQTARGDRLITRLADEVARRQTLLACSGFGSVAEQRAATAPAERLPWLVLLLDGWEGLQAAYDEVDHGRPLDALLHLVREGSAAGLRIVVAGDRELLTSRLGASVSDRLLLRLADAADFGLAGVPSRAVPATMPPGRVVCVEDEVEAQVALLDRDPGGRAQVAAVHRIAAAADVRGASPSPHQRPLRVEPLPTRVEVEDLRAEAKASATGPWWALIGVGGDERAPVGVDLAGDGPGFVVCGPPGSGRSTVLATMARWLGHQGLPVILVGHSRSPLLDLRTEPGVLGCLGAGDDRALEELLAAHTGDVVVVADDAETLHDTPIEVPMAGLLRPHASCGAALVLAGATAALAGFFRGLTVDARRNRCGLLLGAITPVDGDLLGVRVPRSEERQPGRGLLVVRGRTQPVQVAISEPS